MKALEEAAADRQPEPDDRHSLEFLATSELRRLRELYDKASDDCKADPDWGRLSEAELRIVWLIQQREKPGADRTDINARLRQANAEVPWPPPPCAHCDDGSGRPLTPAERARAGELIAESHTWPRWEHGGLKHEPPFTELQSLLNIAAVGEI